MRRARRPAGALAAALALAGLGLPADALGHAQLTGTSPQRGATVRIEPGAVTFRFDETVEGNFGAVRVFDARGGRVDQGGAFHPHGTGAQIAVRLRPRLHDGTYTATYRVVSADGHVVSGGFVFSIGTPGAPPAQTVAQLAGSSGTGPGADAAFGLARGLEFAAIALAAGGVLFLLAAWLPGLAGVAGGGAEWEQASAAFVRRARRALLAVCALGAAAAFAGVVMEGAEAAGISGWSAVDASVIRETLGTRFGLVWGLAVLAWILVAALGSALLAPRGARAPVLASARLGASGLALPASRRTLAGLTIAPLAFLVALPALSGHGSQQDPVAVMLPANLLHVAAMSAWAGGLAVLVAVVPAATRRLEPGDRSRLLAALLVRFSPIALGAVVAILATGLVQSYVEVRTLSGLTSAPFGRAVLVKLGLLLGLIAIGAWHRRVSIPRLRAIADRREPPGAAGRAVRRALRAEVLLLAAAFAATAALASYAPPVTAQAGPVSRTAAIGPAELQLTVDPARVGANQVHLYLTDPKDGRPFTAAKEITLSERQPDQGIGPLRQAAEAAGPGHAIVPAALLTVPGNWKLEVAVRVSEFDEYTATVTVPVR